MILPWEALNQRHKDMTAQLLHDCFIAPPYNNDWKIIDIFHYINKHHDNRENNESQINIKLLNNIPVGVAISRGSMGTPSEIKEMSGDVAPLTDLIGEDFIFLHELATAPEYQNKGIARELLSKIVKRPLLLYTQLDSPSIDFYRYINFKEYKSSTTENKIYFYMK